LQKSNNAIKESNKSIQDSVAALEESNKSIQDSIATLEFHVKALELKPGRPGRLVHASEGFGTIYNVAADSLLLQTWSRTLRPLPRAQLWPALGCQQCQYP
jgi:hypothetical protein